MADINILETYELEDAIEIMKMIEGGYSVEEAIKEHFETKKYLSPSHRLPIFYNKEAHNRPRIDNLHLGQTAYTPDYENLILIEQENRFGDSDI